MRSTTFGFGQRAIAAWLGLLLVLPGMVGCGARTASVSGQVLLDGRPLPGGFVLFRPANPAANSVSAVLDDEGRFEVILPVGNVQVAVDNRELKPRGPGHPSGVPGDLAPDAAKAFQGRGRPDQPKAKSGESAPAKGSSNYKKIPDRYYSIETSRLTYTVKSGSQEYPIELTSK